MGYSLGGTISNLLSHKTGLPSTAIAPIGSKNIANSYKYKKYFSFDDSNIVTFGRKGDNLFNSALKNGKQSGKIYVLPDLTVKEAGPYTPVTGNHILGLFRDNDIDKAILHNFYGTGLQIKSLNPMISNPFYTKP